MKVHLASDLFQGTVDHARIVALIGFAREGRHQVMPGPDAYTACDVWLNTLLIDLREQLGRCIEISVLAAASSNPDGPTVWVQGTTASDWTTGRLAPQDALDFLAAPLRLLVENRVNDGMFLRALAPAARRTEFENAIERGWITIEMGGGLGEMSKRLSELSTRPLKGSSWHLERLRLWVMFDRDADRLDPLKPSADSDALVGICGGAEFERPWPLPFVRLSRRSIESYLPLEVLPVPTTTVGVDDDGGRHAAFVELRLRHPDLSFSLDMKRGIAKDSALNKKTRGTLKTRWDSGSSVERSAVSTELVPHLPAAWAALPPEIAVGLAFGFGDAVGERFAAHQTEPQWEEWVRREHSRGPPGQPSRASFFAVILEHV